jgi:hypothetical protein
MDATRPAIAFEGDRRIAEGPLAETAISAKAVIDRGERAAVLIFDAVTSERIDVVFQGSQADVLSRFDTAPVEAEIEARRGPGRPKLGVVAREVTLLPRHWDWLNDQPGGASVALRKLVEEARRRNADKDRRRHAADSAYRFMTAMAGDAPGFEEASRALFAADRDRFAEMTAPWPPDVRAHVQALAVAAFAENDEA